ncbi:hypothetical protein [Candidatus Rhabdochlamydia porcellionis]|jgi:hypothetical protein|uniref:Cell division protein FtsL n=1 Tax=Candidatus Rhabdochlamydia porcellionis TaxID=225148 RepID=A0ABX8YYN5_9BACT|nr:hypothetical protein [Candidatus Rhabdochlamydia porcellionis]QZA58434.1 hypothetical protein RHAB15C_0000308 [Candidatus Rhabdochlamydia porcellionis]
MLKRVFIQLACCIGVFGCCLCFYINTQNAVTRLRLEIPILSSELNKLKEQNNRLKYEIDLFESPEHLMQLARCSEFSHLKYPMLQEVLTVSETAIMSKSPLEKEKDLPILKWNLAVGAKQ